MAYNSAYTGAQVDAAVGAVRNKETTWDAKQNALSGTEDQIVGFNSAGNATPVPKPTASDVGAVPTTRTVNGKALSADISLTAADVGAKASTWLPTPAEIGAATPAVAKTVTLYSSGWSSNSQTVTVNGVLADETKQLIQPMPAMASQYAYYGAGVLCSGQAANSLTFTCQNVPTEDLTVYVVMQEVGA